MRIVFWSNQPGHCAVTSSLLGIMCSMVLNYGVKGVAISLAYKGDNFDRAVIGLPLNGLEDYFSDSGMDALIRSAKANSIGSDTIIDCGVSLLGKKFNVIPKTKSNNRSVYEQDVRAVLPALTEAIDKCFAFTFIDAIAGNSKVSEEAIKLADLVVVCLNQEEWVQQDFFQNYNFPKSKTFYLLGNYDIKMKNSVKRFMHKEKFLTYKNVGVIPNCPAYADAMNEGNLVKFFLKNNKCSRSDPNYLFVSETKQAAKKILVQLGAYRKDMEDDG